MTLNPEQLQAVRHTEGRVLVLAGAGSGKTRVITHRAAHLIQDLGKNPRSILGLTFTNKAAAEMRHRLEKLIEPQLARQVTLSTFHSFCMQVLRKEIHRLGYTREFSLYDERDMRRLVTLLAKEMLNSEQLPSMAPTLALLSHAREQADDMDMEGSWHNQFTKDLHTRLQASLRAYNAVCFDSLLTLTIQLFKEHPDVLERTQDHYRYLMIDEYQDTNPAQLQLAELLAKKHRNLCVVGDDDQSIYGWRGAEVKHILDFKADKIVKLEQNYRSTPIILQAANAVIANNQNRHKKELWSKIASQEPIEIFNAAHEAEEAQSVVERLIRRHEAGMKWKDMAILYRSNALSRQFELALMQASWQKEGSWVRGIPYEIFGGLEFSERAEIKDLFAYLRLIANPQDTEALLRIVNVPRRGISDALLDQATQCNRTENKSLWNVFERIAHGTLPLGTARAIAAVRQFVELIQSARYRFSQQPLFEALRWLIETIQYKKAIEDEVKSEKMREFKWENVQECVNALAQYEETAQEPSLQDFIATSALGSSFQQGQKKRSTDDLVQLMTIHSAKGLEFPACFIVGLEDHLLPHEKSAQEVGVEEERRLFYVGITRAERHLTLSMSRSRMRFGKLSPSNPSRFLFEIPKHLLKPTSPKLLPE